MEHGTNGLHPLLLQSSFSGEEFGREHLLLLAQTGFAAFVHFSSVFPM
jgi:hypothetical protein